MGFRQMSRKLFLSPESAAPVTGLSEVKASLFGTRRAPASFAHHDFTEGIDSRVASYSRILVVRF
jgi:hypothetical protein